MLFTLELFCNLVARLQKFYKFYKLQVYENVRRVFITLTKDHEVHVFSLHVAKMSDFVPRFVCSLTKKHTSLDSVQRPPFIKRSILIYF